MFNDANLMIQKNRTLNEAAPILSCFFYLPNSNVLLWSPEFHTYECFLDKLVFKIARKPNFLISHIQRIYYCFHEDKEEQLFAALVDFLFILNKRGEAISWRMLMGVKSRLHPERFLQLKNYLKNEQAEPNLLVGNHYSILTRGFIGGNKLVIQHKPTDQSTYDPLALARDYIEYSQLEEAKKLLERALLEEPARLEIHHELLSLYRSMRDHEGFYDMFKQVARLGIVMNEEWVETNTYFTDRVSNG